jgi:hypothetical protein
MEHEKPVAKRADLMDARMGPAGLGWMAVGQRMR